MELGAAEGDDQREIVGEALGAEVGEDREIADGRIAVEPEPPFAHAFGEHEEEGREAEVRALLIDEGGVEHFGAGLARPGDAHAVEQRVQDAEADIHAVDGHAGLHQPLHGDLDQRGERRVGEAGGDDRGRDVGDVRQAVQVELVHGAAPYRGFAWRI